LLTAVLVLAGAVSTLGCVCDTLPGVETAFREASAVFSARYVGAEYRKGIRNELREMDGEKDYEVQVLKFEATSWWKGAGKREVILISDNTRAKDGSETVSDCGLGFEKGRDYLIYAYGKGDDFGTGACTLTKRISRARDDIRRLNKLASARKPSDGH
jgi:hypothetical protein